MFHGVWLPFWVLFGACGHEKKQMLASTAESDVQIIMFGAFCRPRPTLSFFGTNMNAIKLL